MGCKRYLEHFLHTACQAGVLQINDVSFASQQFIYQLKSFVFYPALFGLTPASKAQQQQIIAETVAMFLARYRRSKYAYVVRLKKYHHIVEPGLIVSTRLCQHNNGLRR